MTNTTVPRLLSVAEAADVLGVCTETVRRAIWRGELSAFRIGRTVRLSIEDIRTYLATKRGLRG